MIAVIEADAALPHTPSREELYEELVLRVRGLLEGESDWLANLANLSAAVYEWVPGLNWAGFYLLRGDTLLLGPFQGLPACVRIPVGAGVCGTAVASGETQVVRDVEAFPGHIACDARSRSEIVVPIRDASGALVGVLDLDSAELGNFGESDRVGLEAVVAEFAPRIDWRGALA